MAHLKNIGGPYMCLLSILENKVKMANSIEI